MGNQKETHDGIYIFCSFNPVDQGYRLLCGEEPCYLQLEYRVTDESVSSLKPLILDIDSRRCEWNSLKGWHCLNKGCSKGLAVIDCQRSIYVQCF